MTDFFKFFADHWVGMLVLFSCLAVVIFFIQWIAWVFQWGRFKIGKDGEPSKLRFILGDLVVKIIDDFRHLLALIIVLIFIFTLGYVMARAGEYTNIKDALQTVVASLGGLIGTIIGYYFGESAARKAKSDENKLEATSREAEQNLEPGKGEADKDEMKPVPAPF